MPHLKLDAGNALYYEHHAPTDKSATFVFCNSMGLSTAFWRDHVTPDLRARGFGTLAFDYRGQGRSRYDASATLEPDEIISDIGRLLRHLAPHDPILVGISIGGQYAAKAILAGSSAVGLVMSNSLRKEGAHTEWIIEIENRLIELGGLQLAQDALSPVISSDEALAALRSTHLPQDGYVPCPENNPRLRTGRGLAKYKWDVSYEELTLPVLALTGSHDRLFRVQEHVDELVARLPNGTLVNFPAGGHVLHRELPGPFVNTLERFADSISRGEARQPTFSDDERKSVASEVRTSVPWARSSKAVLHQHRADHTLFSSEEIHAPYGYLSGYRKPRPLEEQVSALQASFPGLDGTITLTQRTTLPEGAEGWFALPRWEAVATTYNAALEIALSALKDHRKGKFFNYRRGRLSADVLRQHPRTLLALQAIAERQPDNDILVVPAQFGLRHAGRSMRRARAVFAPNEFGLGAFHVATMLLTHPDRLHHYDDLWTDCLGDEYDDLTQSDRFVRAPRFIFDGGQEEFGTHWIKHPEDSDGSVSAFLYA